MSPDTAAIDRLYRSHGHIVLRRARMLLGSEADAQEALQEVFTSLLRSPETVRNARSLVGWLYRATTHFCLNQLRNLRTGARLLESRAPAPVREVSALNIEATADNTVARIPAPNPPIHAEISTAGQNVRNGTPVLPKMEFSDQRNDVAITTARTATAAPAISRRSCPNR